jgi:hypothetical protein
MLALLISLLALAAPLTGVADARPLVPAGVSVIYAPCPDSPDAGGCAYADQAALARDAYGAKCRNPDGCVYVANHDRFNRLHELGHVFDARYLTDANRAWFARKLGMAGPWLTGRTGIATAGEQFADAYANCVMGNGYGRRGGMWESSYDYNFQPRRHRRICLAIEAVGYMNAG